jgi:hypothetical protein
MWLVSTSEIIVLGIHLLFLTSAMPFCPDLLLYTT